VKKVECHFTDAVARQGDCGWPSSFADAVFSGNYPEVVTKDLDEDVVAEHYDYNSNSDLALEDVEDLKPVEKPFFPVTVTCRQPLVTSSQN
jgi:hypothetical protein